MINLNKSTSVTEVNFSDSRQSIPNKYQPNSVELTDFRYADFKQAWFNATIASFSTDDPTGLEGLKFWLNDHSHHPNGVLANRILQDETLHTWPVSLLESTLLRVWLLKRIALRHGTIHQPALSGSPADDWIETFNDHLLNGLSYS